MTIQYDKTEMIDNYNRTEYNIIFTLYTTKIKGKTSNHDYEKEHIYCVVFVWFYKGSNCGIIYFCFILSGYQVWSVFCNLLLFIKTKFVILSQLRVSHIAIPH